MAVSTLAISLVFLIRNSSVSMAVNALLIFFGYLVLHGLESILGLGYNITIFWAISNINKTRIDMAVQWLPTAIIIFFCLYDYIWWSYRNNFQEKRYYIMQGGIML